MSLIPKQQKYKYSFYSKRLKKASLYTNKFCYLKKKSKYKIDVKTTKLYANLNNQILLRRQIHPLMQQFQMWITFLPWKVQQFKSVDKINDLLENYNSYIKNVCNKSTKYITPPYYSHTVSQPVFKYRLVTEEGILPLKTSKCYQKSKKVSNNINKCLTNFKNPTWAPDIVPKPFKTKFWTASQMQEEVSSSFMLALEMQYAVKNGVLKSDVCTYTNKKNIINSIIKGSMPNYDNIRYMVRNIQTIPHQVLKKDGGSYFSAYNMSHFRTPRAKFGIHFVQKDRYTNLIKIKKPIKNRDSEIKNQEKMEYARHHGGLFSNQAIQCANYGRLNTRFIKLLKTEFVKAKGEGSFQKNGNLWLRICCDQPISARASETRMGKGKGDISYWVANVVPGQSLLEFSGGKYSNTVIKEIFEKLNKKSPIALKLIL